MKATKLIGILLLAALTVGCSKDELTGQKGDKGDKGDTGATGPAGPSNILSNYTTFVVCNDFSSANTYNKAWRKLLPTSSMPSVNANHTVIGFVEDNPHPTAGYTHWSPMPYTEFYGTSNIFRENWYTVDHNGRTWVWNRMSDGGYPCGSQASQNSTTSGFRYKFYVLKKLEIPSDLDLNNAKAIEDYVTQNPSILAFREIL